MIERTGWVRRTIKKMGMVWIGEVPSQDVFRKKLEKKGYHVVEINQEGNLLTAWTIYIRNLSKECKDAARKITKYPKMGDTINWTLFPALREAERTELMMECNCIMDPIEQCPRCWKGLEAERDAVKTELETELCLSTTRADQRDRWKKLAGELAEATRRVLDTHLRQERVVDMRQALKKYDSVSKEAQ